MSQSILSPQPGPTCGSASRQAYLIGGGIASLSAAALLIRDGGFAGQNIHVIEAGDFFGGALDGSGSAEEGYVVRGGRMMVPEAFRCTFDLFSLVPSLTNPSISVLQEILDFNERVISGSRCRLLCNGEKLDVTHMGFSAGDRIALGELIAMSEDSLGRKRIEDFFDPEFFKTRFWYMWGTMFAFQPWHSLVEFKRYVHRFIQLFPTIGTLSAIRRTPYNQFDSVIRPLLAWIREKGVRLQNRTRVTDLHFNRGLFGKAVESIEYTREAKPASIAVQPDDIVLVTNGSMTASSTLGSKRAPAPLRPDIDDGAWSLWEALARKHPEFGKPEVFKGDVDGSKWLSFTTTLKSPLFFDLMEKFTGNKAGTGGLVTFTESNWLMSIVLMHQPHFVRQPEGTFVFWGYGLFADQKGNRVPKRMADCTGEEILTEVLHHLPFREHQAEILASANCIPCMMPYITSQFMPRLKGDRPDVIPRGTSNFAFVGQFCEMPDEVVFTMEYAVRSAMTAVYSLLNLDKSIPPIYKGHHDIRVFFRAFQTMMN